LNRGKITYRNEKAHTQFNRGEWLRRGIGVKGEAGAAKREKAGLDTNFKEN
jgi:hypothetical protein